MNKYIFLILFLLINSKLLFSQEFGSGKNALKTTFLSFATGSAKLTYERSIFNNQSIEITGGYIGVGFDGQHNHPRGGLFRYAHKFILNYNPKYPLDGIYIKPEIALSSFNYNIQEINLLDELERINSTMGTLLACFGYQWGKKAFTFDSFIGIGGALGSECDTNYQHGFILWNFFDRYSKNVSLTFGMKLGVCFGNKEKINF